MPFVVAATEAADPSVAVADLSLKLSAVRKGNDSISRYLLRSSHFRRCWIFSIERSRRSFAKNSTKAGEWDSSEQAILIVAIRDYEAASPVSTPKS
jgi:hypothetical protein